MIMRVTISSSGGTLRTISLADTLYRQGYLRDFFIPYHPQKNRLVSRLKGRRVSENANSTDYIYTNVGIFLLRKLLMARSLLGTIALDQIHVFLSNLFDRYVARHLAPADILFAEIMMSLRTIQQAKKLGMITILDRGNTHIQYQMDLLREEYVKLGLPFFMFCPRAIKRSLQEYAEADYISVLSSFAKRSFLEKGISEHKILLIPPGIDLKEFRQVKKEDEVFRIIYCGQASIKKGTHYLLNAFKSFALKNAELLLIGEVNDDFKSILQQYAGYFKHISHVPRNELYKYFSQGSVFVLPSLEEGFGKVVVEAMACGLPVIVTTNTCGADVVREGQDGFVIPIRDVEALKEKLLFFFEHQELGRQMGQSAKGQAQKMFSEDAYTERFIRACIEITRKKSESRT